jgi:hypothetical protein
VYGGGIVPDLFIPLQLEHGNENLVYMSNLRLAE